MADLHELLQVQSGVISRRQIGALKVPRPTRDTMLRRRDLVPLLPGVYVNHTGPPSREQRVIAAVLYAGRSALHLDTAIDHPSSNGLIHVAIDDSRRVRRQPGIRIHRVAGLEDKVLWNLTPPRIRPEFAALELSHRATTDIAAIAALTDVVGARRTTASRLTEALSGRSRIRRRPLLIALILDLAAGTHSVLEHGFLTLVVRSHELPEPSDRQAPRVGVTGSEYRDVEYAAFTTVVELDSRWHDTAKASDRDADRDLDDLANGQITTRLRYHQVFATPCRTAGRLGAILQQRGWAGAPTPCSPACLLASDERGNFGGSETSNI